MDAAKVYLVGAGPGDPGLMTVRGRELLERADAVLYDALVGEALLDCVSARAELVYVGKRGHEPHLLQEEVNALLVETALSVGRAGGTTVVRLKGGDPFLFGRGGEEALALSASGVPFEVVPGVTSGIAAPAYAGIPVTHRGLSSSVTFVTAREAPGKSGSTVDWNAIASLVAEGGTACLYMGMRELRATMERVVDAGVSAGELAAVVQWGTTERQRVCVAPVGKLADEAERLGIGAPAIVTIGKVAGMRAELDWLSARPLHGKGIVVTRPKAQSGALVAQLRDLGARTIEFPAIEIAAPDDWTALDDAIANLERYRWVVFTSVNGVDAFFSRLRGDARRLGGALVAAIGPATARSLAIRGIAADVVPGEYRAEAVSRAMADCGARGRVLIPRAQVARDALPRLLREAGMSVDVAPAYKTTLPNDPDTDGVIRAIEAGEVNAITFTSPSTVFNTVKLFGTKASLLAGLERYSIGPVTSAALREVGLPAIAEAAEYTIDGLVTCILGKCPGLFPAEP